MKNANARVNEDIAALKGDLCRLAADLREIPDRIRCRSRSKIMKSRERLWDTVLGLENRAKDHIRDTSVALKDEGHYVADKCRGGIGHRPITSMAVAFAAGLLLASLFERRWH
jgi:ElaB/YqjD/DUF883 family membrane-anchored ribosome-binding protein